MERLASAAAAEVPDVSGSADLDLERRVVVLGVHQVEGLEFDSVVVAGPQGMSDAPPRGFGDLCAALTRIGRRLHILHSGPVPNVLKHLSRYGH
ncbi:hypothetical protein [Kitasatospora sp. NPDC001175]